MGEYRPKTCETCIHNVVCSNKEDFKAVQDAIDNLSIPLGDKRLKRLTDFDWINSVRINCKYYAASAFLNQR